jgi:hypothetical protein
MELKPPSKEERLLADLYHALEWRGVTAALGTDDDGSPCLVVADSHSRTRRVRVQLSFFWFYWGDRLEDRASCHRVNAAADRIAQVAKEGWPAGEQRDLTAGLAKVLKKFF